MKCDTTWTSKFEFTSTMRGHSLIQDASAVVGGTDHGPTPKELLLAAICGCTGMDVVGLMKKNKIQLGSFKVTAEAETTRNHPKIFKEVLLSFSATGEDADSKALVDAVEKSQNLYCGVSAMVAKACKIRYRIELNGAGIHEGQADFPDVTPDQ